MSGNEGITASDKSYVDYDNGFVWLSDHAVSRVSNVLSCFCMALTAPFIIVAFMV